VAVRHARRSTSGRATRRVRLDRERLSASAFNLFDKGRRRVSAFGVSNGDAGPVPGQALGERSTDATRTAGDECDSSSKLRHDHAP